MNYFQEGCSFKKMYTPLAIHLLFCLGVILTSAAGLIRIIMGLFWSPSTVMVSERGIASTHSGSGWLVLSGFVIFLLGPVFVRVICEVLLTIFRILDVLTEIRDGKSGGAITTTTTSVPPASTPGM